MFSRRLNRLLGHNFDFQQFPSYCKIVMSKRKAPSSSDNSNSDLCDFLIELANYERNVSKNIYKYNAYRKAATTLSELPERVKSGEEARKLPGIGDKIAKKIDEFLETGKLRKLEDIKKDDNNVAINLLTRVSGIGPAKAKELVEAGIKTLEHLKKHQDKLNHHQKIGLKYLEDFETKIPRDEIKEIEKIIKKLIRGIDKEYIVTICGSYRRKKQESGDIDVLLTHPSFTSDNKDKKKQKKLLQSVVKCLEESKLVTDTISQGESKFMGVCRLNHKKPFRRLDIRLAPNDQYYCAVLYFTGSDLFNKNMRAHALEKKFSLNEYNLRKLNSEGIPDNPVRITCEEDIFKALGLPYKQPEERNI